MQQYDEKAVLCNASDVKTDGTYKRYFPFGVTSARKQNAVFHGKLTKNLTIFCVKSNQLQRNDGGRRCGILAYSALSNDEARQQMVAFQKNATKSQTAFSSKTVLCNASDVETDGTYKRYFPFGETSARKQNAVFHEKENQSFSPYARSPASPRPGTI